MASRRRQKATPPTKEIEIDGNQNSVQRISPIRPRRWNRTSIYEQQHRLLTSKYADKGKGVIKTGKRIYYDDYYRREQLLKRKATKRGNS